MGVKLTKLGEQVLGTGATVKRTVDTTERPGRSRTFTAAEARARKKRNKAARRARRRNRGRRRGQGRKR